MCISTCHNLFDKNTVRYISVCIVSKLDYNLVLIACLAYKDMLFTLCVYELLAHMIKHITLQHICTQG